MKWTRFSYALLLAGCLAAQPPLHLKGLRGRTPQIAKDYVPPRQPGLRRHVIVQFKQPPAPEQLRLLEERGAALLEYVPEFAYVASVPEGVVLADLNLAWSGSLAAAEKLSPALRPHPVGNTAFAVVQFYPDVAMADARAAVLGAHLQIHDNPDLLERDLLVSGPPGAFLQVARADEVEYIFPASDDLMHGRSVNACAGALTAQGPVGQSIRIAGKWPTVDGIANLGFAFVNVTEKLPPDQAESEIVRALSTWSKYAPVNWTASGNTAADQTVAILFGRRDHGDGYPFDGPGGIIAHTFFPYPVSAEPRAGDMHFDDEENWRVGTNIDLFSVALHEAGHALGLGHSDDPTAVMYPYYRKVADLSPEDIAAIQHLYPAPDPQPPSPAPLTLSVDDPGSSTTSSTLALEASVAGGVAPVAVTWSTDAGASGPITQAVALHTGLNTITVSAIDSAKCEITRTVSITYTQPATQPGPAVQITSPAAAGTYTTSASSIVLSGTASNAEQVTWRTSLGAGGVASGTALWSTTSIQLASGSVQISVTATGKDGQSATATLVITRMAPPSPNSPGPLTIVSPALTTLTVTEAYIAVSGTAGSSVTAVSWTTSGGDSGIAMGTSQWSIPAIPLYIGTNTVTISATDKNGSSWRSLIVTRTN